MLLIELRNLYHDNRFRKNNFSDFYSFLIVFQIVFSILLCLLFIFLFLSLFSSPPQCHHSPSYPTFFHISSSTPHAFPRNPLLHLCRILFLFFLFFLDILILILLVVCTREVSENIIQVVLRQQNSFDTQDRKW